MIVLTSAGGYARMITVFTTWRATLADDFLDPSHPAVRHRLARLVQLLGLLVWSDSAHNACGHRGDETERDAIRGAGLDDVLLHLIAQRIQGAGEWVRGSTSTDAHADAMDLPVLAWRLASSPLSVDARQLLGLIISRRSLLWSWGSMKQPLDCQQIFDDWAARVRTLAVELAAVFASRFDEDAAPWTR